MENRSPKVIPQILTAWGSVVWSSWGPGLYCGRRMHRSCTVLWLDCGFREAPERQPCPGWGRYSFSQDWFYLFFFSFPTKIVLGGLFQFLFSFNFSLVFLCLSSFLPISHFSVTTCHSSLPQSCTWLSPRMVFTKQGSVLTNIGTSLPLPLVQAEALMSELE